MVVAAVALGCAIRLAPDYDQSIVAGLEKANEQAMTLFASVAGGTSPSTFGRREAAYNSAIGALEALRVSAEARPDPSGGFLARASAEGEIALLESPTPEVLAEAAEPLVVMRATDRARGLSPSLVEGFKTSYITSISQALTYEKALQR